MVCALPLNHSGRFRTPWALISRFLRFIAVPRYRSRFMVGQAGLNFCSTFVALPFSPLPPRGSPHRFRRLYDTAFDRSAPMSSDHILGLDATPAPLSGAVLPSSFAGLLESASFLRTSFSPECCRLSSISRFPSTNLQPRGSQGLPGVVTSLAW